MVIGARAPSEAEYPAKLVSGLARGVQQFVSARPALRAASDYDFTEIYSGPKALVTHAVQALEVEVKALPEFVAVGKWLNTRVRPEDATEPAAKRSAAAQPGNAETKKEALARANKSCIGGMRDPHKAMRKLPRVREVGRHLRNVVEKIIAGEPVLAGVMEHFGSRDYAEWGRPRTRSSTRAWSGHAHWWWRPLVATRASCPMRGLRGRQRW